jgi:quercetin dioxygenase-like cupin family protein
MFRNLIPMLADKYHVVAPDFPGYGESSAPSVNDFDYSYERLATVTEKFTEKLNLSSYALYLSDIGWLSQQITERTEAMHNMKKLILSVFIFTFGFATATHAQQVNTLLRKQLPETPGKEIEVITVNYAPGAVDAIHRHDAHAVVYVLDGEVEMQVRGGTLRRLGPGQVFYESPEDVHTVSRNASKTKPAKFVVFFIKNEGAPILTPVH